MRRLTSLITLFLLSIQPVEAQINADVTVGLDGPTRDLIAKFPKEVHDQLIAALGEALPMLDKSVTAYLDKINDIMDHQINHAHCAMTGVVADVTQRIIIFQKDRKGPLLSFDEFRDQQVKNLHESTSPNIYSRVYNDIAYEAVVTYCEMEILGSSQNAVQDANTYRELTNVWFRVKDSCGTPADCITKQFIAANTAIKENDPRDVQAADAVNLLVKVDKPTGSGLFRSFDPNPYNIALTQLLRTQDAIFVAKFKRQRDAAAFFTKAKDQLSETDGRIAGAKRVLVPQLVHIIAFLMPCTMITAGQIAGARRETDAARTAISLAEDWLNQSSNLDKGLDANIAELRHELQSRGTQVATIEATKEGPISGSCP
jgi:hypothetical protein